MSEHVWKAGRVGTLAEANEASGKSGGGVASMLFDIAGQSSSHRMYMGGFDLLLFTSREVKGTSGSAYRLQEFPGLRTVCSDAHIRTLCYHEEFRVGFSSQVMHHVAVFP